MGLYCLVLDNDSMFKDFERFVLQATYRSVEFWKGFFSAIIHIIWTTNGVYMWIFIQTSHIGKFVIFLSISNFAILMYLYHLMYLEKKFHELLLKMFLKHFKFEIIAEINKTIHSLRFIWCYKSNWIFKFDINLKWNC